MQEVPAARRGTRFGRYEALFRIASGGMAEVYAARIHGEGGFEKLVALKRMLPTLAEDERFVTMFLDEGRLAANISSPHVVQTLDLGRADDDSLYLVMELVVGVSLGSLLRTLAKQGKLIPVPVAVEIIAQAAQGLHDAHEARTVYGDPLHIVHRDVSPANVLIDVGGRVRITDFGVARALERMTHTQSGEVKGKIAYFSPEQARGKEVDRRTDVFALGIVAWETLTGRRLFAADNPAVTLNKIFFEPIPRLESLRREVPRAIGDAVARALERELDRRTPTAADFARALRAGAPSATNAEIGAFVREHGGDALARVQEGLRALQRSGQARSAASGAESGERSGIVMARADEAPTTVTPSAGSLPGALLGPDSAPSAPVVHARADLPPVPPEMPTPAAVPSPDARSPRRRTRLVAAIVLAAALAMSVAALARLGALAWLGGASGAGPEPVAVEVPAPAPLVAPAVTLPAPSETEPAAPSIAAPEPVPPPGASALGERHGGRRGTAARGRATTSTSVAASPRPAEAAAPPSVEPPPPRESTPAPVRAEQAPTRPRVETVRSDPGRADPLRADPLRTDPVRSEPRGPGLRGLDDFEREIQR